MQSLLMWKFSLFNLLSFQPIPALAGLAAALIPLVIHLSRSRRTKTMRFSTTRFFTDQFLRSYRMSQIREVLLLIFRMALCALLGFALAQPALPFLSGSAFQSQGSRAVVVVLDDSASMGYVEDDVTLLDRARKAAHKLVEGLRPGDSASLVLAGRRADGPRVPFPQPTTRLDDVLQAIDAVKPSALGADLTEAVPLAEEQAHAATADRKEVYVFSDLQETGWPDAKLPDNDGKVALSFVQVRPLKPVANLGVTAVQFASARPMAGAPFTIRPLLSITGEPTQPVDVKLFVAEGSKPGDAVKVGEQRVERLQSGRWAAPRFTYIFPKGGWYSGWVEVEDQTLGIDNRRYFALEVLDAVKVLAVEGGTSGVEHQDELFFLRRALTASPDGGKSPIDVDVVAPPSLADADLGRYPLVVLADVETLPPNVVDKLEAYVAGGGSLWIFLGGRIDPDFYNERLMGPGRRDGGLMPARLLGRQGDPAADKDMAHVSDADFDHPALSAFREPGFASLVGSSVTFKALWKSEALESADVLMKASTGYPLLVEKPVGRGRVMLFTSSCNREWTNFPIRPSYLPWVHRLTAYLTQEPLRRDVFHIAGRAVELAPGDASPDAPLRVRKPDGKYGASRWDDQGGSLEFAEADEPGVYAVETADQKAAGLFAVNVENYESKLTYLDELFVEGPGDQRANIEASLKKSRLANRPQAVFVEEAGDGTAVGGGVDPNLWVWVLLAVLGVALFEPTLANRISALLFARPRDTALPGSATVSKEAAAR